MGDQVSVRVKRFDPESGEAARLETFSLPREVTDGMTIVTALGYIQQHLDPTLAFYCSCELGRCRACLMDVNGSPTFACTAPLQDGALIEPLAHLPVIRDLIVKFLRAEPRIDQEACTGCGTCMEACPMDIYELADEAEKALVRDGTKTGFVGRGDLVDCMGCRRCEKDCPAGAIQVLVLEATAVMPA